jgi:hypothetical protein
MQAGGLNTDKIIPIEKNDKKGKKKDKKDKSSSKGGGDGGGAADGKENCIIF